MTPRLVLGIVVPAAGSKIGERIDAILRWMSAQVQIPIHRRDAASYEVLAADVREGRTDVAWLPPIVYLRLGADVTPLGSLLRRGTAAYDAALIVREDSKIHSIDGLRGLRAGWVDRWSAAGYVLPRINLALHGLDPRTLFRSETFHGSHRSLVKALVAGACDVAGTYAGTAADGSVTGGWSSVPDARVRVLARFGAIPPDVIAVRTAIASSVGRAVFAAFKRACTDEATRDDVREVFECDETTEGLAAGYDSLARALASSRGIFE